MCGDGVYVVCEGKGHHIGIQAIDDGSRLTSGTAVRLLYMYRLPGSLEPMLPKGCVHFAIEFPGRIVRCVQDGDRIASPRPIWRAGIVCA